MRLGTWEISPQPGLTLAMLVVVGLCVGLGFWQLSRADEKRALAELLETRVAATPQPLDAVDVRNPAEYRFLPVSAVGSFDYDHQFYIEHRTFKGRNGVHVITPLHLQGNGRTILVNRGWISREEFDATKRYSELQEGVVAATGLLVSPAKPPIRLGPANSDPSPWLRSWLFADPGLFAEKMPASQPYPLILLLDADWPGPLKRAWELPHPDPSMHYGYAIQWFAFALIAIVVWATLSREKRGGDRVR